MKAHLVKGSTLWCSHDFRPRSIVLLGIHMMCPPFIIRHATNEELSLDAHDEKSQGWCWRLVTSVVKKESHMMMITDKATFSVRSAQHWERTAQVYAHEHSRTCPQSSSWQQLTDRTEGSKAKCITNQRHILMCIQVAPDWWRPSWRPSKGDRRPCDHSRYQWGISHEHFWIGWLQVSF